jgi:hypothetical protein
MSTTLFTALEGPVRDWLRTQSITSTRVYVGLPADATFPAVEVTLIDSGIEDTEAPIAHAMFSFSVWAAGTTGAQKTAAASAAYALASLLLSTNHAVLDDDLVLMGSQIALGPSPRYDPDGTPRYVIEAALTLVKTA